MNIAEENRTLEEKIKNKKLIEYCKRGIPPHLDSQSVCNFLYHLIIR